MSPEDASMVLPLEAIPETGYMNSTEIIDGGHMRSPFMRLKGFAERFPDSTGDRIDRLKVQSHLMMTVHGKPLVKLNVSPLCNWFLCQIIH